MTGRPPTSVMPFLFHCADESELLELLKGEIEARFKKCGIGAAVGKKAAFRHRNCTEQARSGLAARRICDWNGTGFC
jgi:hypothetical protein